jgi:hypothetical protein
VKGDWQGFPVALEEYLEALGILQGNQSEQTILSLFRSIYEKQPGEAHPLSWRPFL